MAAPQISTPLPMSRMRSFTLFSEDFKRMKNFLKERRRFSLNRIPNFSNTSEIPGYPVNEKNRYSMGVGMIGYFRKRTGIGGYFMRPRRDPYQDMLKAGKNGKKVQDIKARYFY